MFNEEIKRKENNQGDVVHLFRGVNSNCFLAEACFELDSLMLSLSVCWCTLYNNTYT